MAAKNRTDLLTTTEMYHLDQACQLITKAFGGECPYLVGTAGLGGASSPSRRSAEPPCSSGIPTTTA